MSTPDVVVNEILAAKTAADFRAIWDRHQAFLCSNEFFWRAFVTPVLLPLPPDSDPRDVTLATIRDMVDRELQLHERLAVSLGCADPNPHTQGRLAAMRQIRQVLDMHGKPAGEPVHLGGG